MNSFLMYTYGTNWFMHHVVSAIIHSAIYGMAFHLFKNLSTGGAILLGMVLMFLAFMLMKAFR